MTFTIIVNYVLPIILGLYFVILLYLILRSAPVVQQEARRIAIGASILWSIMLPVSLIMMFLSLMGSGGPNAKTWLFIWMGFSLLLLFLLCLYSLTNIWMQYRFGNYKRVIYGALAPYVGIILFGMAVAIQILYLKKIL